jgi:XTP/dITP diphosphohydrolase
LRKSTIRVPAFNNHPVTPPPEGSPGQPRLTPSHRLLIATGNPGKVREFIRMLDGSGFEVVTPADIGLAIEVEENGDTYEANATLKAIAYARASGFLSLADDSGIEVDALDGRPGVRSARYGTPDLDDAGRTALLLHELEGVPPPLRTARYVAVVALVDPSIPGEPKAVLFRGVQEGCISSAPRGTRGFGYDPVFLVDGQDASATTQAELAEAAKDAISHRGQALRAARSYLQEHYGC